MRIALFQDTWHPSTNGVVVSTELFREALARRGHETLLIAPRHPRYRGRAPDDVCLVPAVAVDWIYPGCCLGKPWCLDVGRALSRFAPDLIHSTTEFTLGHWLASYFRARLGVRRVHTFHTLWTEYFRYAPLVPERVCSALFRWLVPRAAAKRLDHVLVPSEAMLRVVVDEWRVGVPVTVLPTGVRVDEHRGGDGARFRDAWRIDDSERVLLYLGRLGEEKNIGLVLETLAELRRRQEPRLRLVVAGGGPQSHVDELHARARALGLHDVAWAGFLRGEARRDCYAAADLVLFPSVTETQGLVVLEALAAERPLVSVEAMGPGSVMKGELGCLFALPDACDFADKAQRLLHDDVLYERKRGQARALARECSSERRAEELEAVYRAVLGHPVVERGARQAAPVQPLAG